MKVTRRGFLGTTAAAAAAVSLGAAGLAGGAGEKKAEEKKVAVYKNADFYGAEGKFDAEKAKKAYFDMMERFGYPVYQKLREEMWAIDFGLGRFTEVGMGGIFWINDKEGKYLGHEIYLLPGQMIPEHWHVKTDESAAKAEAWQLRYGGVTLFGEGDATAGAESKIPASEREFTTVKHATVLRLGDVSPLSRIESRHFMVAGPEGCIVTEYASYHDNSALRFTDPKAKL
jgi:D-lyxose ketol-isomerase